MRRSFLQMLVPFALACGGGGDGDGGGNKADSGSIGMGQDAMPDVDAALPEDNKHIGDACTPPIGVLGKGDCPDDYLCMPAIKETDHPFCSKTCTMYGMTEAVCTDNYDGPSAPGCFYTVTIGMQESKICGVLCKAPVNACPANVCNGQCPGEQTCQENPADPQYSFCQ